MCIATVFALVKTWQQSKFSLAEEWINELWYMLSWNTTLQYSLMCSESDIVYYLQIL